METKNEVLKKFAEFALDTLKQGKDFVVEQAPDLIQQLLLWQWWSSLVICILCLIVGIWFFFTLYKTIKAKNESQENIWGMIVVPSAIACIPALVFGITNLMTLIKISVAPKIFLIEYFSRLVS